MKVMCCACAHFIVSIKMDKKAMKINLTLVITCCMVVAVCSFKEYQVVSLNNTNRYRRHHNVVELEMKDDLNTIAETCAKYYVEKVGTIDHSCKKGPELGENLWMADGGGAWTDIEAGNESASLFYSEICFYTFGVLNYGELGAVGHFTQLVWKDTKELGIGFYENDKIAVLVAIYRPPGNYDGEELEQVLPEPEGPDSCLSKCETKKNSSPTISTGFLVTTLSVISSLTMYKLF